MSGQHSTAERAERSGANGPRHANGRGDAKAPPAGVALADQPLSGDSVGFIEQVFDQYLNDPASVSADWQAYFRDWPRHPGNGAAGRVEPAPWRRGVGVPSGGRGPRAIAERIQAMPVESEAVQRADGSALQERADALIRNFRVRGHIIAQVDPLGHVHPTPAELDPWFYGFTEEDMERPVSTITVGGPEALTLRQLIQRLKNTYSGWIGAQFMHIDSLTVRSWLQERMEGTENRLKLSRDEQLRILTKLTDAVMFEEFLQKKYVGAKSFSLEGAESLIPLLDMAIEKAGDDGNDEIVIGMAHRGRLNVLANIMGKSARQVFREYEDVSPEKQVGGGDVKYHLGYSSDWITANEKKVHLSLCFNPSHLEYVNTVALGRLRAKQDRFGDDERRRGMVILIHGDAAFAGEGVVQETLNLSELPGYRVGGTIHVIVNNQVGFTTTAAEARSSTYATDVAKMLQSPIFHVNGENPEAVAQVIQLSMDFRRAFQRDVVIDMYCYRRRGHNEGDEPSFTQPLMYKAISAKENVREGYLEHLLKLGGVTREEADEIERQRHDQLEAELKVARSDKYDAGPQRPPNEWSGYFGGPESDADTVQTAVDRKRLAALLDKQTQLPEDFHPHPKVLRLLEARREMAAGKKPLDWSSAEALAFASLVTDGYRVRLSGQDSGRGTFSQRHAILYDYEDGHLYIPLARLSDDQAEFKVYNSPLSEAGVLGYEYGYSLDWPDGLILWEAQFGDFVNAGQVIVDQFIASAEDKWRRLSGLVMLLPHGFEGQGPEHSSARIERFLEVAAEDNIQVVNPTTPAQYFHVLRQQGLRKWRKPLIVMTPKSLLRLPAAVSSLDDLTGGAFQKVLPEANAPAPRKTAKVLLCSGKIAYELEKKRADLKRDDVMIARVEQLYPLPTEPLKSLLSSCREGTPVVWVQEEPENMGAWRFLFSRFGEKLLGKYPFSRISRPASASPATGSHNAHKIEQEKVLTAAFA